MTPDMFKVAERAIEELDCLMLAAIAYGQDPQSSQGLDNLKDAALGFFKVAVEIKVENDLAEEIEAGENSK